MEHAMVTVSPAAKECRWLLAFLHSGYCQLDYSLINLTIGAISEYVNPYIPTETPEED